MSSRQPAHRQGVWCWEEEMGWRKAEDQVEITWACHQLKKRACRKGRGRRLTNKYNLKKGLLQNWSFQTQNGNLSLSHMQIKAGNRVRKKGISLRERQVLVFSGNEEVWSLAEPWCCRWGARDRSRAAHNTSRAQSAHGNTQGRPQCSPWRRTCGLALALTAFYPSPGFKMDKEWKKRQSSSGTHQQQSGSITRPINGPKTNVSKYKNSHLTQSTSSDH